MPGVGWQRKRHPKDRMDGTEESSTDIKMEEGRPTVRARAQPQRHTKAGKQQGRQWDQTLSVRS